MILAPQRKRMLALLIEDVTITTEPANITAGIRWRGGQAATIQVSRTMPIAAVRRITQEVIAAMDQLLESYSDAQTAKRLNDMGYGNWRHEPFTYRKVRRLRRQHHLSSRIDRLRARGFLAAQALSKQLGVSVATVHSWGGQGLLQRENCGGSHFLYRPVEPGMLVRPTIGRPPKAAAQNRSTT